MTFVAHLRGGRRAGAAILACAATIAIAADGYPVRPVRFIVAAPPGGSADPLARLIGLGLAEAFGQQVVVDNRPGAQTSLGTALAAKAPPDGHTMLLSYVGAFAINPWIYPAVGYDPLKDFAHASLATDQPYVVVVNPALAARSVSELVSIAKARPARLTFASSAATGQLAGELFKLLTGTDMVHVPYKGAGPAIIDVIGGHVDVMFASPSGSIPQVKGGKLRALVVTAPARLSALPDVPTSREAGLPDLEISGWYGVALPAQTPQAIVRRVSDEVGRVLRVGANRERLLVAYGLEARGSSPESMTAFVRSEHERWGKVVKAVDLRAR